MIVTINNGDANNDSAPGTEQSKVTSIVNIATGKYASLFITFNGNCEIANALINAESNEISDK